MAKFNQIINDKTPVLVDFYADWCQPCKMMSPVLKQLKDDMGEQLRIIKIDVDKHAQLSAVYNIRSVPTLMLFKEGNVAWTGKGVVPAHQLKQIVLNKTK